MRGLTSRFVVALSRYLASRTVKWDHTLLGVVCGGAPLQISPFQCLPMDQSPSRLCGLALRDIYDLCSPQ